MSRITPVDPKTATGDARRLLDAVQAQLGVTPNFIRILAKSPKALEGFLGLYGAASTFTLSKASQEGIALAVAESNACEYCVSAHTAIGRHAGLSNEEMLLRVPNIMKRECAVTILAQNAKQGTLLSHSKPVTCDKVLSQHSCQPEGLQPESALAALLDLAIE